MYYTSEHSGSTLNLEVLVFGERGKPEYPEKNLSDVGAEKRTNNKLNPHMTSSLGIEPGHIGGRRVLSPLRHPCSPKEWKGISR